MFEMNKSGADGAELTDSLARFLQTLGPYFFFGFHFSFSAQSKLSHHRYRSPFAIATYTLTPPTSSISHLAQHMR